MEEFLNHREERNTVDPLKDKERFLSAETRRILKRGALILAGLVMASPAKAVESTDSALSTSAPETTTISVENTASDSESIANVVIEKNTSAETLPMMMSSSEILQNREKIDICRKLVLSLSSDELFFNTLDPLSGQYYEQLTGNQYTGRESLGIREMKAMLEVMVTEYAGIVQANQNFKSFDLQFSIEKRNKGDQSFTIKDAQFLYKAMQEAHMPEHLIEYVFEEGITLNDLLDRKNEVVQQIDEMQSLIEKLAFAVEFGGSGFNPEYEAKMPLFDPRAYTAQVFGTLKKMQFESRQPSAVVQHILENPGEYSTEWISGSSEFDTGHFNITDMAGRPVLVGEVKAGSMLQYYAKGQVFGEPIALPRYALRGGGRTDIKYVHIDDNRPWWKQVLGSMHLDIQINAGVNVDIHAGRGIRGGGWEPSPIQWQQQPINWLPATDYVEQYNGKVWNAMTNIPPAMRRAFEQIKREHNESKKFAHHYNKLPDGQNKPTKNQYYANR